MTGEAGEAIVRDMARLKVVGWGLAALAGLGLGSVLLQRGAEGPVALSAAGTPAAGTRPPVVSPGYSNILRGDYVGPEKCKDCHEEQYADWKAHPHSRMNKDAADGTVRGDFSHVTVPYEDGSVTFDRDGASYTMALERAGKLVRRYRVTRTVGSRFMQFYIGVQLEGPEPGGSTPYVEEHKLPFGYWFKLKRWLPVSYFDPVGPETKKDGTPSYDPFDSPRVHAWRGNCMLCHNTYPYILRMALPDGLSGFKLTDMPLARREILAELGKTIDLTERPNDPPAVRTRVQPANLVTLGVSCESCHFGGRGHTATNGETFMPYLPTSPLLRVMPQDKTRTADPTAKNPYAIAGICGQCHTATVTLFPNGAGTWNSREAVDMAGGACTSRIRCTDCHDPHRTIGPEAAPIISSQVAACTSCHPKLEKPEAAAAHSRHDASVSCLDCHMPRWTQGLEEVVRTHRISSPTDVRMLAAGSANACNLCHLDRSVKWTTDELAKGWGKKIEPAAAWEKAYGGSLETPVGIAWLHGEDPSMRLVATQAYARSPLGKAALGELVKALDDRVAVNRVFATFAVGRVRGQPLTVEEFDVAAKPAVRAREVEALLAR
jgi:predicted CXXCH cytochrome family protein